MRIAAGILFFLIAACGNGMQRDLASPPLQIEGTKISQQSDAKRIALDAYIRKMRFELLATEAVQDITVITLGYDVRGFAAKNDRIWEARVKMISGQLRSIIWANPNSGNVRFVCGPREEKTAQ